LLDGGGSAVFEDLCGVESVVHEDVAGVVAAGGELPVGALRCFPAGLVRVGRDEHSGPTWADVGEELVGLLVGECGAQRRCADVGAVGAEGDGDRVDGAFD